MAEKNPTKVHHCPPIPEGWGRKVTGPAWRGESTEVANAMWQGWLRTVANARPMPRRTVGEARSKDGRKINKR